MGEVNLARSFRFVSFRLLDRETKSVALEAAAGMTPSLVRASVGFSYSRYFIRCFQQTALRTVARTLHQAAQQADTKA